MPKRRRITSRVEPAFEPALIRWPPAGVYQLWLRLPAQLRLRVGALGLICFPPGLYVYTGRAGRGLVARVRRHARRTGVRHWHIDYLLAEPAVRLERVTLASPRAANECHVNQTTAGQIAVSGFGSSDCRGGCGGHLRFLGR